MGTGELLGKPDEMQGGTLQWTSILYIQGRVVIILVALCLGKKDNLLLGGATRLKYRLFLLPMTVPLISQGN